MTLTLTLPQGGALQPYTLRGATPVKPAPGTKFNRIAYSAAHVVADPLAAVDPWLACAIDWDTTSSIGAICGRWAWASRRSPTARRCASSGAGRVAPGSSANDSTSAPVGWSTVRGGRSAPCRRWSW